MRIAFYAPMKPPTHPVPSGDRRMGRLLMAALRAGGHRVEVASKFRSYEGKGDFVRQTQMLRRGRKTAERLIQRYRTAGQDRPDAWFTYHLYHKAPDWLGPPASVALDIPYLVAEASHAPKQAGGPWRLGYGAAADAIARADRVFCLNSRDTPCLRPLVKEAHRLVPLKPFLESAPLAVADRTQHRADLAQRLDLDPNQPWLLAVGMMRAGDKLASYRILGRILESLPSGGWQLIVIGDGPARGDVDSALANPGPSRVHFLGELRPDTLAGIYAAADILVWPAIREAYGMALLEAQAAGLPVVAGNSGGVPDIVANGETGLLAAPDDADALATAVAALLDDPDRRAAMGAAAQLRFRLQHDLASAAAVLNGALAEVVR